MNIYYVHSDHLNAPRKVAQPTTGTLAWRWDTDPYGTAAPNQNPAGLGNFPYNLRFPGQYYQTETGLNQNWNREYDPLGGGRYLESDPILLPRTNGTDSQLIFAVPYLIKRGALPSAYVYVSDQPTLLSDPEGLNPFTFAWDFIKCMYYSNKYLNAVTDCKGRCGDTMVSQLNFIAAYKAPDLDTAVFKCACQNAGGTVCLDMFKSCGKAANGAPSMAPLGPLVK